MSGRQMIATRTYMEMRSPAALRPARVPDLAFAIERLHRCPPAVWRFLYTEVGRRYRWLDRLDWTDGEAREYLESPGVHLWMLTVESTPAGYFELRRHEEGSVEIAYFGLIHAYTGQGLGGHLLSVAVREAWALTPTRVWLHTSDLDHPAALPNYLARGFIVTRREHYIVAV